MPTFTFRCRLGCDRVLWVSLSSFHTLAGFCLLVIHYITSCYVIKPSIKNKMDKCEIYTHVYKIKYLNKTDSDHVTHIHIKHDVYAGSFIFEYEQKQGEMKMMKRSQTSEEQEVSVRRPLTCRRVHSLSHVNTETRFRGFGGQSGVPHHCLQP